MDLKHTSYFRSFFHSLHIVVLDRYSSLITLSRPSLTSLVLKLQIYLIIIRLIGLIMLLFCGTVSHLIYVTYVARYVTPSPILNSPVWDVSTSHCLFHSVIHSYLDHSRQCL